MYASGIKSPNNQPGSGAAALTKSWLRHSWGKQLCIHQYGTVSCRGSQVYRLVVNSGLDNESNQINTTGPQLST